MMRARTVLFTALVLSASAGAAEREERTCPDADRPLECAENAIGTGVYCRFADGGFIRQLPPENNQDFCSHYSAYYNQGPK
jgi:hypothetical protein